MSCKLVILGKHTLGSKKKKKENRNFSQIQDHEAENFPMTIITHFEFLRMRCEQKRKMVHDGYRHCYYVDVIVIMLTLLCWLSALLLLLILWYWFCENPHRGDDVHKKVLFLLNGVLEPARNHSRSCSWKKLTAGMSPNSVLILGFLGNTY